MRRYIKRIEVGCMNNFGGLRWYEIKCFYDNEEGYEAYSRLDLNFTPLKRLGIVKTFNSTKKLNTWLNSPEGRKLVVERLNERYDMYTDEMGASA